MVGAIRRKSLHDGTSRFIRVEAYEFQRNDELVEFLHDGNEGLSARNPDFPEIGAIKSQTTCPAFYLVYILIWAN